MIRLHGEFKKKSIAKICITEGPDKDWNGEAVIYENQKGLKIARANSKNGKFPSGQDYYINASFNLKQH